MSTPNTVFLRLEGPLQSWGTASRFVIRDTSDVPTKSGVLGLVCAAMGKCRAEANQMLPELTALKMGVRIDRPGMKLVDYHTAGARYGMMSAAGILKKTATTGEFETHVMRKEYLADAAFVVALKGRPETVESVVRALERPEWPPFLGRKSCPPSVPVFAGTETCEDLITALKSEKAPWLSRIDNIDELPNPVRAIVETSPSEGIPVRDVPLSFTHWNHGLRWVNEITLEKVPIGESWPREPPAREGKPATTLSRWKDRRQDRLYHDRGLCVFCKQPARDVHHVTYANVGHELSEDLRSVCRLCHDAITLLEYAAGMTGDRIDPCVPMNRTLILSQRTQIMTQRDRLRRNRAFRVDEEDE